MRYAGMILWLTACLASGAAVAQTRLNTGPLHQPDRQAETAREQARQRAEAQQREARERQEAIREQGLQRQERHNEAMRERREEAGRRADERLDGKSKTRRMDALRDKADGE